METTGLSVYVFRTGCAIVSTIAILNIFKADFRKKYYSQPLIILTLTMSIIFICEFIIMLFLLSLPPISVWHEALIDALILSILISPGLYSFVFKPLIFEIKERTKKEVQLQAANEIIRKKLEFSDNNLERSYEIQKILNEILKISLSRLSLNKMMEKVLDIVLSIPWISFESRGGIFLADEKGQNLIMNAQRGLSSFIQEKCNNLPYGKCLCGRAAQTKEIVFSAGLDNRHEISYEGILPHGHYCVPIMNKGNVLGVINIYTKPGHVRNGIDEELLIAVSNVLSGIILHKQTEEKLDLEKERIAVTLRNMTEGVIATDTTGKIVLMNKTAEALTGWPFSFAQGTDIDTVFNLEHPENTKISSFVKTTVVTGLIDDIGNSILTDKNGAQKTISASISPIRNKESVVIGTVIVFIDITEKLKTEKEMLKAQKLESIGLLAGGIAHDFNNFLTTILGNISIAKTNTELDSETTEILTDAENAAFNAKNLTHQLLTFSKGGNPVKEIVAINELVSNAINFCVRGTNVRHNISLHAGTFLAEADKGQITQVINNLVINAVQAMPDGGTINVTLENIFFANETRLSEGILISPGNYVEVSIQDSGIGIAPEHLNKIFDAYFTTKQKGSGLGLAVTYSIIKKHNGYLTVESTPGKGTTFHIYLPAVKGDNIITKTVDTPLIKGKGRILLLDDDEMIIRVAERMLNKLGYDVDSAKTGEEIIKIFIDTKTAGGTFAAVILDLTILGGMGGLETAKKLIEIDKDTKMIVSSGYSSGDVVSDYKNHGFIAVLSKPYLLEELSKTLAAVISST
ncbi:MAG: ATP-binding protein [Elusimicrobiota bacterium]